MIKLLFKVDKILIYIGLNNGVGFSNIIQNESFDKCYGFEPIPHLYKKVKNEHINNPKVEIINAAVVETEGEYDFYISKFNNLIGDSSSLFEITDEYRKITGNDIHTHEKIKVKGINLKKFLEERQITNIKKYVSDAEGNDYTILKSIVNFIDQRKIEVIQVESICDYVIKEVRENQPTNYEKDFVNLLSNNYELYGKQEGNYDPKSPNHWVNRDLYFKLKPIKNEN
jgi:FkbM family methyltransferase